MSYCNIISRVCTQSISLLSWLLLHNRNISQYDFFQNCYDAQELRKINFKLHFSCTVYSFYNRLRLKADTYSTSFYLHCENFTRRKDWSYIEYLYSLFCVCLFFSRILCICVRGSLFVALQDKCSNFTTCCYHKDTASTTPSCLQQILNRNMF